MIQHNLIRSESSYFTTKAHYGVGEKLAEMRIDTAGLFKICIHVYDQQKISNTVE